VTKDRGVILCVVADQITDFGPNRVRPLFEKRRKISAPQREAEMTSGEGIGVRTPITNW
jgi:hypothetical protein